MKAGANLQMHIKSARPRFVLSPSHQGPEAAGPSGPRSAQHPVPSAGPPRTEAAASAWPGDAPDPASAQRLRPCSRKGFGRQRMGAGTRAHKDETGLGLCLSSSEAEEAVQEEEEAHLRLVVLGMLQLSRSCPHLSSTSWKRQLGVCRVVKILLSGGIRGAEDKKRGHWISSRMVQLLSPPHCLGPRLAGSPFHTSAWAL